MRPLVLWIVVPLVGACLPEPGAPPSLLQGPRVLAIRSEPAEAQPGDTVTLSTLFAGVFGSVAAAEAAWAFCATPKPPAEENSVDVSCLEGGGSTLPGTGLSVLATVPADSCALFGPLPPPQQPGAPPPRPRDADATGGYYQPIRVRTAGLTAFASLRIGCGVASAPIDVAAQYRARYQPNRNPRLLRLSVELDGHELPSYALPAGAPLHLRVRYTKESKERYVLVDPITQTLVERDEELAVSWFATAGSFSAGRTFGSFESDSETEWTSPEAPGSLTLWAVLRDSRGGIDFAEFPLAVHP